MSGKSVRLYLVDGSPSGLVTAEIGQWTGKATVVPRSRLKELVNRPEAGRPGVYVLVGPDPERDDREMVYIGEAESVFDRLRQHLSSREFWSRAIAFTASDGSLTKAHVKYLESRLVDLGRSAGRSTIDNGNTPPKPNLPEADVADMENFLTHMEIILPTLGVHFLQRMPSRTVEPQTKQPTEAESPVFEISAVNVIARAVEVGGEFIVLKGSQARAEGVPSWRVGRSRRERLVVAGVLAPDTEQPQVLVFREDCAFSSSSLAASVVVARDANGRTAWRASHTGQTYGEWQEAGLD